MHYAEWPDDDVSFAIQDGWDHADLGGPECSFARSYKGI